MGETSFESLLTTPSGFVATGWTTPDFETRAIAIGADDGETWVPLDPSPLFEGWLRGFAAGPRGWVAAEQVNLPDGAGVSALLYWSGDGHRWESLPDQADLARSFPGPITAGRWGFAMLGQAVDAQGTSFPAVWASRDGKVWQQTPVMRDGGVQWVVVVDDGILALSYGKASFTRDGSTWVDVAPIPGSEAASSITATAAGGSDVMVALGSDGSPTFMRGQIDSASSGESVAWTDAGVDLPAETSVSGFAAGPLGAVVLGFDRAALRPMSWSSRDGTSWQRADLDEATFDGGAPGLVAAGDNTFVALASEVNDLGIARSRAWTSTDGLHWQRADTDALGVFPPPPDDPCPASDPTNAQALLDMAAAYPAAPGAVWPTCFGHRELSIRGFVYVCDGCGGWSPYVGRPRWLLNAIGYSAFRLAPTPDDGSTAIAVQIDPQHPVPTPRSGAHVRITGHFDDPASSTCRLVPDVSVIAELVPAGAAIATCRREFVVSSIKVLAD